MSSKNLFFIHTPLQLLVAQQIIQQDKLTGNILLYGYVGENKHFLDIYRLTKIDSMWDSCTYLENMPRWAQMRRNHFFHDMVQIRKGYRIIESLVKNCNIGAVYLGDIKNFSNRFVAEAFGIMQLKVCFFEDGFGHYSWISVNRSWIKQLLFLSYASLIDLLYYKPFYRINFMTHEEKRAKRLCHLPINKRYSIVPFYQEPFDYLLRVSPLLSDKLREYITDETREFDTTNCILFLTSPFYEAVNDSIDCYLKTLSQSIEKLEKSTLVHIKFHPRESLEVRSKVLKSFKNNGVRFIILGSKVNVPVEYYLQFLNYQKIISFFSATLFYNGYLYPRTEIESLLMPFYKNCIAKGIQDVSYIEYMINLAKNLGVTVDDSDAN